MKKVKGIIGILSIIGAGLAIYFVLGSEHSLVIHPKGTIARSELDLIITNTFLMLIVIIPTFILLLVVAWKYRSNNLKQEYDPEKTYGLFTEITLWVIPSIIVVIMAVITWKATHKLDPYRPLESEIKPVTIQVVALDWKWLFIYPEQGIATVNFVQFPGGTPIHFALSADASPMNSFWIPQLSGQIYCMAGMITPLHIMADGVGEYSGRAAEINGQGYAGMTFVAKSTSQADFEAWITDVKKTSLRLNDPVYKELVKPSENHPITLYSHVEKDLFNKIVMHSTSRISWQISSLEN